MKRFLQRHPETVFAVLALVFLGVIVSYFSWGLNDVIAQLDRAITAQNQTAQSVQFNISGAQKLDLRGLVKTQP